MEAGDDAASAKFYPVEDFVSGKKKLAFDHLDLLNQLIAWREKNIQKKK